MSPTKLSATFAWIFLISCCGQLVNVSAIKCLVCDSTTDPNCITDLTKVPVTTDDCTTQCFTKSDAGKITRGCVATGNTCTGPGCLECKDEQCNKHNICKTCDSSTNADCSITTASKDVFNSVCPAGASTCISKVKDDKQLERRCATNDDVCSGDTCALCTGANCNVGIFPKNRRQCYKCPSTDTKCANVAGNTDTIKSVPCQLYNPTENCYTFGVSETNMARGCVSDTDTNVNKCSTPGSNEACAVCGTDNCNNRAFKRDQVLTCVQCNSSADKNCLLDQKADSAKACQNKVPFNVEDACYIETLTDKNVVRGCLSDRTEAQGKCTPPNCETCTSGNGCNSKADGEFTCIRCRSDVEPKCKNDAASLTGTKCRNQELTATNMDCFTGIWNNNVIRGCLVDADARQQLECADAKSDHCKTCTNKNCNVNKTNGAAGLKMAGSLFAVIMISLWRLV